MTTHPWEEFFDGHAPEYLENPFTKATQDEIAFLLDHMNLAPGAHILDMGCGAGRHAVPLAKLGFKVTGVDLSAGMLEKARDAADEAQICLELIHCDATKYRASETFDAAICLCEGAFGLLSPAEDIDAHDAQIVANIFSALKPGAPFILTGPNGWAKLRQFTQESVEQGRFDPYTLVETFEIDWETPQGPRKVLVKERGYLPGQLEDLFLRTGFLLRGVYGGTAGSWGERPVQLDDIEIMVIAQKPR